MVKISLQWLNSNTIGIARDDRPYATFTYDTSPTGDPPRCHVYQDNICIGDRKLPEATKQLAINLAREFAGELNKFNITDSL